MGNEQIETTGNVKIEHEHIDGNNRWFTYSEDETGLKLVCLEDMKTGATLSTTTANTTKRTASHRAWASARQSRSSGTAWEIMNEMGEKGINPDEKLDEMFRNYGHASVGDMARITIDFANIPMHLCMSLFNTGVTNSGQEKSTRYQPKFGKSLLHSLSNYHNLTPMEVPEDLEKQYYNLGELSQTLFNKHRKALTSAFNNYYQSDKSSEQKNALGSRVLDCARSFLLFGQYTGMSFETSARDWSRIISELKASHISYYSAIGTQIETLLAPQDSIEKILAYKAEAPSLIRHTKAEITTNDNITALRKYLETKTDLLKMVPIYRIFRGAIKQETYAIPDTFNLSERMLAQYIQLLCPAMDTKLLLVWVHSLDTKHKLAISQIVFNNHSNYNEMPLLANVTNLSLIIKCSLGEVRDFNRHRAWGRFIPLSLLLGERITYDSAEQILSSGFTLPLYLTDVKQLIKHKEAFDKDMNSYYKQLRVFVDAIRKQYGETIDYTFIINLLPLAHATSIWMHGNPKQALYMTKQRVRPGGHINYRMLAYEASQAIANSDLILEGMRLLEESKPDANSKEQFFDRG